MPKEHRRASPSLPLRGKVLAFNVSPRGHLEGALVSTKNGVAQVNFPKHGGDELARSLSVGASVELAVELETDEGEHPVYRALGERAEVSGTIVRLNYALHGEINGFHLDDGTFVHLKPEGAKRHDLRVGQKVRAAGERRRGADAVVLEASDVAKLGRRHDVALGA